MTFDRKETIYLYVIRSFKLSNLHLLPMKSILLALSLAVTSTLAAEKPNILFIFADDMAFETVRANGRLDIDTPNLDRLVENGTNFTRSYNMGSWAGAVCVASRSMLVTGKSVWHAKNAVKAKDALNSLWPKRLQAAGYDTYLSGKWHVPSPSSKAFMHTKNVRAGMPKPIGGYNRPLSPEDYENWLPWDKSKEGFWVGGKHWSEVLADDTIEFLSSASEKENPFFMYIAFNAPHDPRQSPKEYIDMYPLDRIKLPSTFQPQHPQLDNMCGKIRDEKTIPFPRTEYAVKVNRQEYFALVTHMDEQIGRILDALDASGKAENTLIVFTADHGLAVGHHGLAGKQNMYEHSLTVPFIITGPNIPKGKTVDTPIYLQDVMPTTLEWAGAKADNIFFKSVTPLIHKEKAVAPYPAIYGAYLDLQRAIIKDNWKLIYLPKANIYELYNIAEDPYEATNLIDEAVHAEKIVQLKKELLSLNTEMGDPFNIQ